MKINKKAIRLKNKREQEIKLIVAEIAKYLNKSSSKKQKILEFGCGAGYQVRYLQKLGDVISTDIYTHENIEKVQGIQFIKANILRTPFNDNQFDLLFSNHVLEHIEELVKAFNELKRIGNDNCLYAFSVPTNIWLLLSIPSQLLGKIKLAIRKMFRQKKEMTRNSPEANEKKIVENESITKSRRGWGKFALTGHGGVYTNFFDCYRQFKIDSWKKLFIINNFKIISVKPLLLYAPSELPIIPTINPINNICSSVLFIMIT